MFSVVARARVACVLLFVGIGSNAPTWAAEPFNPQGELTLAQAVDAAIRSNPDLLASGYELNAAQARIVQANLRPNPQLSLELENFVGTGDYRGVDQLETTLSLSQVVELGGKRSLRRSTAEADLDAVTIEQRARELDVLAEVTRRFIDVTVAQERVAYAAEAASLSEKLLQAIGARVDAGRSPEAERSRARIALTRARIEQQQAHSDVRSARYALSAMWGVAEPAFSGARAQLFTLRPVDTFQALSQRLDESPDLIRFASESRLREAELRLARAQARPDLTFSVGARRLDATNDTALVAGFTMPLPTSNRNQGAIREAQVRITQTDAMRDAARLRARSALLALYQEMTTAAQRMETLQAEGLPQAQQALDQTRSGYERGRFSFLDLATAQEELLALRSATIDAAADYHRMLIEIERL
ncbi:MAG TPA: TolC family protein, partial [Steroidobacter sp.]|nr:TolC family protein [Steroidobacter sp.]